MTRRRRHVMAALLAVAVTACSGSDDGDGSAARVLGGSTTTTIPLGAPVSIGPIVTRIPVGWAVEALIPDKLWEAAPADANTDGPRMVVSLVTTSDPVEAAETALETDFEVKAVEHVRDMSLGGRPAVGVRITTVDSATQYTEQVVTVAPSGRSLKLSLTAPDVDTLDGLLAVLPTVEFAE